MADTVVGNCCLVNACAAGEVASWLGTRPEPWHVPRPALREALFLHGRDQDDNPVKTRIDLNPLIGDGALLLCDVASKAEDKLYMRLSRSLDDAEAMALTLATIRGWTLATDDRVGRRLANRQGVELLGTPEILKRWADDVAAGRDEVKAALRRVQELACFVPDDQLPLGDWWAQQLKT